MPSWRFELSSPVWAGRDAHDVLDTLHRLPSPARDADGGQDDERSLARQVRLGVGEPGLAYVR
jgi:hypothetical protein